MEERTNRVRRGEGEPVEDSRHTPPLPTREGRRFVKVSSFKMWAR